MTQRSIIGYDFNDGGRADAGLIGTTGDCVIRAIAIATKRAYLPLYKELAGMTYLRQGIELAPGYIPNNLEGVYQNDYEPILTELGYTKTSGHAQPTYLEAYLAFGDCLVISLSLIHI